jgi:hypothetical protein
MQSGSGEGREAMGSGEPHKSNKSENDKNTCKESRRGYAHFLFFFFYKKRQGSKLRFNRGEKRVPTEGKPLKLRFDRGEINLSII